MTLDPPLRKLARILAEQPRVPVSHDQIIKRMWPEIENPDTHARGHLRQLIYRLRAAYLDEEGEYVVATQPRVGYVWLGGKPP